MDYSDYQELYLNNTCNEAQFELRREMSITSSGKTKQTFSDKLLPPSSTNQSSQNISLLDSQYNLIKNEFNEKLSFDEHSNFTFTDYFDFNNYSKAIQLNLNERENIYITEDKDYRNEHNNNNHCLLRSINKNKAIENIEDKNTRNKELKRWIKTTKNIFQVHKPIYDPITKIRLRNRLAARRHRNRKIKIYNQILTENKVLTLVLKNALIKGHFDAQIKNKQIKETLNNVIMSKKTNYFNLSQIKYCIRNKILLNKCNKHINSINKPYFPHSSHRKSSASLSKDISNNILNNNDIVNLYYNKNKDEYNLDIIKDSNFPDSHYSNRSVNFFSNYDFYGQLSRILYNNIDTIDINNISENKINGNINIYEKLLMKSLFSNNDIYSNNTDDSNNISNFDIIMKFSFLKMIKNIQKNNRLSSIFPSHKTNIVYKNDNNTLIDNKNLPFTNNSTDKLSRINGYHNNENINSSGAMLNNKSFYFLNDYSPNSISSNENNDKIKYFQNENSKNFNF